MSTQPLLTSDHYKQSTAPKIAFGISILGGLSGTVYSVVQLRGEESTIAHLWANFIISAYLMFIGIFGLCYKPLAGRVSIATHPNPSILSEISQQLTTILNTLSPQTQTAIVPIPPENDHDAERTITRQLSSLKRIVDQSRSPSNSQDLKTLSEKLFATLESIRSNASRTLFVDPTIEMTPSAQTTDASTLVELIFREVQTLIESQKSQAARIKELESTLIELRPSSETGSPSSAASSQRARSLLQTPTRSIPRSGSKPRGEDSPTS